MTTHAQMFTAVTGTENIIPDEIFQFLPFKEEALSAWDAETDVLNCLRAIYSKTGYEEYADYLYANGKDSFVEWGERFVRAAVEATPAPGAAEAVIQVPEFYSEPYFGLFAKYKLLWSSVTSNVLSESAYFSIAHILESEEDLNCSVHLAANLFYKQASQILRGFIENLVLPIHFCKDSNDYSKWKQNNFRVPPLRGKNGLLTQLLKEKVISENIAKIVADLYGELNEYIHGNESRLINSGLYSGRWNGSVFKFDHFTQWVDYFKRTVEVGVHLLKINLMQWEQLRPDQRICCICHGTSFDTETALADGSAISKVVCMECGNEMSFNDSGQRIFVASITIEDEA